MSFFWGGSPLSKNGQGISWPLKRLFPIPTTLTTKSPQMEKLYRQTKGKEEEVEMVNGEADHSVVIIRKRKRMSKGLVLQCSAT
jgi:hypothetical protein